MSTARAASIGRPHISPAASSPARDWPILVGLFAAAFIVRLAAIALGADNDDGDAVARLLIARGIVDHPVLVPVGDWFPGHYSLLVLPYFLGFRQQVAFMTWTALMSAPAVPLLFVLVRDFLGRRAATWSALVLALSVLHIRFSILTVSDGPFVTAMLLGVLMFCRYLARGRASHLAIGAAAFSAACALRHEAWLFPVATVAGGVLPALVAREPGTLGRDVARTSLFTLCGLTFPLAWCAYCWAAYGDPLYVQHFAMSHIQEGGLGIIRNAEAGYLLAFWPALLVAAVGPLAAVLAAWGFITTLRRPGHAMRLLVLAVAIILITIAPARRHVQARYGLTAVVMLLMFVGPAMEWLSDRFRKAAAGLRLQRALAVGTVGWLVAVPLIAGVSGAGIVAQKLKSVSPRPRFDADVHQVNRWLQQNGGRNGAIVLAGDIGAGGPWLSLVDRWYEIQVWDRYLDRRRDPRQLYFTRAIDDLVGVIEQERRGYVVTSGPAAGALKAALDSRLDADRRTTSAPVPVTPRFSILAWQEPADAEASPQTAESRTQGRPANRRDPMIAGKEGGIE